MPVNQAYAADTHSLLGTDAHGKVKCNMWHIVATTVGDTPANTEFIGVKMKKVVSTSNAHILVQYMGPFTSDNDCQGDDGSAGKGNRYVGVIPIEEISTGTPAFGVSELLGTSINNANGTEKTCEIYDYTTTTQVSRYWSCSAEGALTLHLTQGGADDCATPTTTYVWAKDYAGNSTADAGNMCSKSTKTPAEDKWYLLTIPESNGSAWCPLPAAPSTTCTTTAAPATTATVSALFAVILSVIALVM